MKRFTSRIILCLVPVVLAAFVVARAYTRYEQGQGGFRLGVDLVGGTILVYEVDPTKKLPENFRPEDLAAALKRRIDPADLYNVTIRPVAGDPPRVEIVLPTGGVRQARAEDKAWRELLQEADKKFPVPDEERPYDDIPRGKTALLSERIREKSKPENPDEVTRFIESGWKAGTDRRQLTGEEIENIKNLVAQQGRLEFQILANRRDDGEAIQKAEAYLRDAANAAELKRLNELGEPPPSPRNAEGGTTFPSTIRGETIDHTYSWVEIGKEELYSLHLNSQALAANPTLAKTVEEARDKQHAFPIPGLNECLLYCRTIANPERILPRDRELKKTVEYFVLSRDSEKGKEITGDYLVSAREGASDRGSERAVHFAFDSEGGNRFWEVTSRNKPDGGDEGFKRHLAIILDRQVRSAPVLNQPIRTQGQITGQFTQRDIETLVTILRAGALPATLRSEPVSQSSMGATLGEDTIRKGTTSVMWAFVAVLAFMVFYYRFAGFVACLALLANLLLTVAFMVLVSATFTLPGLAGLVLMLGMAVDANVLIYERLREERERGASLALAIRNGYDRAFPTIIDTHLSSIFTAIVLYVVGNDQLKGFGISLTVGLIISLFTSLYMTRTMFDLWLAKGWLHKLSMANFKHWPVLRLIFGRDIDFMAIRYYWFTATVILTIVGAALFIWRLDKGGLNIDFEGGTAYTGQLVKMMDIQELRGRLEQNSELPDLSVELIYVGSEAQEGNKSNFFTVRTTERDAQKVQRDINERLGDDLKRIDLKSFAIAKDNKEVVLKFTNPATGEPDYASPAQVRMLLVNEFKKYEVATNQFRIIHPTDPKTEKDERYSELTLQLTDPMDRSKLEQILEDTKKQFAALPQPERLENFDRQLAANTQERALWAILASWGAILLYLWFRFGSWTFGAAAVICLIHDLFFTLGAIAGCHYIHLWFPGFASVLGIQDFKIDLPSVAALLTLVGYSVNDTIVVFDRIREVRGKNPLLSPQMINDSVNQTLSRTLLASLATWLVVFVLYVFGGEGVHLFAFVMVVGVIVGTYSSIYIASPLLLMFGEGVPTTERERARLAQQQPAQA